MTRHPWAFVLAFSLCLLAIVIAVAQTTPTPPAPGRAVLDSGFHVAQDAHGNTYQIDLPYVDMADSQRDDANRYGRLYPSGR